MGANREWLDLLDRLNCGHPLYSLVPRPQPAAEPKQIRRTAAIGRDTRQIPVSQFGRVRALTSYGMTQAQVAELYGVTVQEIERIIGRSGPLA